VGTPVSVGYTSSANDSASWCRESHSFQCIRMPRLKAYLRISPVRLFSFSLFFPPSLPHPTPPPFPPFHIFLFLSRAHARGASHAMHPYIDTRYSDRRFAIVSENHWRTCVASSLSYTVSGNGVYGIRSHVDSIARGRYVRRTRGRSDSPHVFHVN